MDILFQNSDWLVVNKPTGISTHGAHPGDLAAQEWLALHLGYETFVCSRLDKGTSGVLLFARTKEASAQAQVIHERELSLKTYLLLSHVQAPGGLGKSAWDVDLDVEGKQAHTRFEYLGPHGSYGLYRARITRGRTHQIRRHAAHSGIPLLGDADYGGHPFPRLALHCHTLQWPGIDCTLEAPKPKIFEAQPFFDRNPDFATAFDRRLGALGAVTTAYRCVHRGEVAAFDGAIDRYGQWLCVWLYDELRPTAELVQEVSPFVEALLEHTQAIGWVLKRARRDPHNQRLVAEQHEFGEPPPAQFEVEEAGLKYLVTLTESQHIGLFLDQRDNRRRVKDLALGAKVANLFAYTCSFSVSAAAGLAEVVFSVDVAKPCLEIGKQNFALNGLAETRRGKFIQEDVRVWLERQGRKRMTSPSGNNEQTVRAAITGNAGNSGALLDLIVCDPPTFSSTRDKGGFSVETQWQRLALGCAQILRPGGTAFFSTNHRSRDTAFYAKTLKDVFAIVEPLNAPLDFPALEGQPTHVKLFRCRT